MLIRIATGLIAALMAASVAAKLPPPTEAAKAQAAEAAAKGAWSDRVAAYQLCIAIDRTAETYRKHMKAAGKDVPVPSATAPCADPGPYVAPASIAASRPLEASGAHSPPETATAPPSTNATASEISTGAKK